MDRVAVAAKPGHAEHVVIADPDSLLTHETTDVQHFARVHARWASNGQGSRERLPRGSEGPSYTI